MDKSRPSVTATEICCKRCGNKDTYFLTNKEQREGIQISQMCDGCDRFTQWD